MQEEEEEEEEEVQQAATDFVACLKNVFEPKGVQASALLRCNRKAVHKLKKIDWIFFFAASSSS